jgi:outer membrane immunogenic protein
MQVRTLCRSLAGCLVAIGSAAVGAHAQDGSRSGELPPYAAGPNWSGFYMGVATGMTVLNDRVLNNGGGAVTSIDAAGGQGALASIYGGIDYQILPRALVGAMVEATYSGAQTSASVQVAGAGATVNTQPDFGWSALVRAGIMPTPSSLMYFLGGYTGQNFRTTGNAFVGGTSASFARDDYFNGFTLGAGIETLLGGGWSTKLEYRYSQFENKGLPGSTLSMSPSLHAVRAGLTYKFGGFAGGAAQDAGETHDPPVNWTGIYVGVAGGASASVNRINASAGGASANLYGGGQNLLGGVFGGYDWRIGDRTVMGVMGDLAWTGPQSVTSLNTPGGGIMVSTRTSMSWSGLARIGFLPTHSTLLYAAGGYTGEYISTTATANVVGASAFLQRDDVVNGWTVGPGIETVILGGWTTRLEYRYSQFEEKAVIAGTSVQPAMHTIRAGLSYKFGPGPAN